MRRPAFWAAIELMRTSPIERVASLLGETAEELRSVLESEGFVISSTDQSIVEIADASQKPASEALAVALSSKK